MFGLSRWDQDPAAVAVSLCNVKCFDMLSNALKAGEIVSQTFM